MLNPIMVTPFSFDREDGEVADKKAKPEKVTQYLALQAENPAAFFRIGVVFMSSICCI